VNSHSPTKLLFRILQNSRKNGTFVIKISLKAFCTTVYRILAPLTCLLAEILPLTPVPPTKTGRFLYLLQNVPTMSNSIHTVSSSTKYILYSLRSRRIKGRRWVGRREFGGKKYRSWPTPIFFSQNSLLPPTPPPFYTPVTQATFCTV